MSSNFDYISLTFVDDAVSDVYDRAERALHEGAYRSSELDMCNYDSWGYLDYIEMMSY